jgi:uncharacterized protein
MQVLLGTLAFAADRPLRLAQSADRAAFLRHFTWQAERLALLDAKALPREVMDCASLLRYTYRAALGAAVGERPPAPLPQAFQYPRTPNGPRLFQTPSGFAEFADAKTLCRWNAQKICRDTSCLRPGDLLFYEQQMQQSPWHAMVYIGRSHFAPSSDPIVVYHTGPSGKSAGEMRRMLLQDLFAHPEPRWRPLSGNGAFVGCYRWNLVLA